MEKETIETEIKNEQPEPDSFMNWSLEKLRSRWDELERRNRNQARTIERLRDELEMYKH